MIIITQVDGQVRVELNADEPLTLAQALGMLRVAEHILVRSADNQLIQTEGEE